MRPHLVALTIAALAACTPAANATPAPTAPAAPPPPAPTVVPKNDPHAAYVDARTRAAKLVESGDYEGAATAFVTVMPTLAKHPELVDEFWSHNAMMMVRVAQGDPAAALAENDQATLCAARGTWGTQEERTKLALQKDRWHRAYLTRMLADSRTGSTKQALIQYAEAALEDYRPIGYPDSIAILDAYFAALSGKRAEALAAAKKVDPAKNDDLEDLYLVVVGFMAAGDQKGAAAVRRVMRQSKGGGIARPIMLRWLQIDEQWSSGAFTPFHGRKDGVERPPQSDDDLLDLINGK